MCVCVRKNKSSRLVSLIKIIYIYIYIYTHIHIHIGIYVRKIKKKDVIKKEKKKGLPD